MDKENSVQLNMAEDPGNSFLQKQSADFGGPQAASGLASLDGSFLHVNPWQQRPLAVTNQLSQGSELQERAYPQQPLNMTAADQSAIFSQQSHQMSARMQDVSIYTGLNSSQAAGHPTQVAGYA